MSVTPWPTVVFKKTELVGLCDVAVIPAIDEAKGSACAVEICGKNADGEAVMLGSDDAAAAAAASALTDDRRDASACADEGVE